MTGRKRGAGGLTPDDADLWRYVTDRVEPLRKPLSRARPTDIGEPEPSRPPATHTHPAAPTPERRWQPLVTTPTPRPPVKTTTGDSFDPRRAKRIATGRIEIEGRLDLHGLRESEAHLRLRGFLRQAQAQGKRTVLVITGKGGDDDRDAPYDYGHGHAQRGVLKRNVPRWLAEPDLSGVVVSYTTAGPRHGGEGALYVHLRRTRP